MIYTDEQLVELAEQKGFYAPSDNLYTATPDQVLKFGRAVEAGEMPGPTADEIALKRFMALTDASTASGYGHGAAHAGYWRGLIAWGAVRGEKVLEGTYGAPGGRFAVDVTELAKKWQRAPWEHFGLLLIGSGIDISFHSREAADPLVRPKLVINGSVEIPCVADASLNSSAAKEAGAATYLKLANISQAALRFADIPPELVINDARIVLTVIRTFDGTGTWSLLEIVPPVVFDVPTIDDPMGSEGLYFESEQAGADPSVSALERYMFNCNVAPTTYAKATVEEESGEKFVRKYWNNQKQSGSFSIPIFKGHMLGNGDPTEGRIVHLSYKIRLSDNFARAVVDTGKFPGFSSAGKPFGVFGNPFGPNEPNRGNKRGVLWAGNGGGKVHGYDGWSARGGYAPRILGAGHPAAGCSPLHTYSYHLRQGNVLYHEIFKRYEEAHGIPAGGNYLVQGSLLPYLKPGEVLQPGVSGTGTGLMWSWGAPSGLLRPAVWHRVDQIIRINDPTEANGWLDAYIDGRQVGRNRDVQWRSHEPKWPADSTLGVACAWFNFYQGGTTAYRNMTEEAHWDIKHIAIRVLEWDE